MNAQMNGLLEQMTRLLSEDGEDDEGGDDVMDVFDLYLSGILEPLIEQYETDEEEALAFVFSVADEMIEAGTLPPIPEEADDEALSAWVGAAKTAGLSAAVMKSAEESSESADEDEDESE